MQQGAKEDSREQWLRCEDVQFILVLPEVPLTICLISAPAVVEDPTKGEGDGGREGKQAEIKTKFHILCIVPIIDRYDYKSYLKGCSSGIKRDLVYRFLYILATFVGVP